MAGLCIISVSQRSPQNADAPLVVPASLPALAGRYGTTGGLTSATACAAAASGYYVPLAGASTQTACPAGAYGTLTAQTVCLACVAGTYNGATARSTACLTVPAGSYASLVLNGAGVASGAVVASQCAAGKYSTAGLSVCTSCGAGRYSTSLGATALASCLTVAAGYYGNAATGATAQVLCAGGWYSLGSITVCTVCAAGGWRRPTRWASRALRATHRSLRCTRTSQAVSERRRARR